MRIFSTLAIGALTLALAACMGGGNLSQSGGSPTVIKYGRDMNPDPAKVAGLNQWVMGFRARANASGISDATFDQAFRDVVYNPEVIRRSQNQAEFTKSLWEYLETAASEKRVANGRAMLAQYAGALSQIEATYGVDKEVVVAVWGMESSYGEKRGDLPLIEALATLSYDGRRAEFFQGQLIGALKILQSGDIDPRHMTGSWAGAMGHTQFIPTSYLAYAVDFTGDGRRDIWSDDPTDALASTAAYLARSGWQMGQPWGMEVTLPPGFAAQVSGKSAKRSGAEWRAMGITRAAGGSVPDGQAALLLPSGIKGAAFLIYRNFHAIERYNAADAYVIGVGHLSDRLKGGGPLRTPWPAGDQTLRLAERVELQERLTSLGFDTGGTDGNVGAKTYAAVKAFQTSRGLVPDGYPDRDLLDLLRRM
ncbi:membrane-bound lytic murein transglycosylase B [Gemmobacter aquatilis]|uniref:Membrane-bound lytic murein transglycosylase B n=1 Tax=Gemmobacter aquatilis TaxID=933059 RepID=A0A1H8K1M6_9RHOB|nr:lytic murein transglycosylase [Gemmobacter aquatilis]SEN86338.1 membrane-bound lytic murein transglycosylase B [Gemmobacter aquatilis]